MGKNKYKKVYKDLSGKNSDVPGQLCLDINGQNGGNFTETRKMLCSEEASKKYWESLEGFLNAAGNFSRTWHLYQSVKEIDDTKPDWDLPPAQVERLNVMRTSHNCKTIHDLAIKVSKEKESYLSKLNWYLYNSGKAGVGLSLPEDKDLADKKKRDILNAFVVTHPLVCGDLRRQYFREKFLKKALKELNMYKYSDPIGIVDMENAFEADTKWQDHRKLKNQNKKEKSNRLKSVKDPKT